MLSLNLGQGGNDNNQVQRNGFFSSNLWDFLFNPMVVSLRHQTLKEAIKGAN